MVRKGSTYERVKGLYINHIRNPPEDEDGSIGRRLMKSAETVTRGDQSIIAAWGREARGEDVDGNLEKDVQTSDRTDDFSWNFSNESIIEFADRLPSTQPALYEDTGAKKQYFAKMGFSTLPYGGRQVPLEECDPLKIGRAFFLYYSDAVKQRNGSGGEQ